MITRDCYTSTADYLAYKAGVTNIDGAVSGLIEELYDSSCSINKDRIKALFSYLCAELRIEKDFIEQDYEICVDHVEKLKKQG